MKIVTSAEMREIDRLTAERYGVATHTLMENAGTAVADFILEHYPDEQSIAVICGKGNNGGDGFVAARKLHQAGKIVSVLLLCDPLDLRNDAADMFQRLPMPAIVAKNESELGHAAVQTVFSADLLVDAILGTGFRPPLSALVARAIELMWAAASSNENEGPKNGRRVISIDIPSGADPDADTTDFNATPVMAPASAVVTFTAPRRVHVRERVLPGPIVVTRIGSPEAAIQSSLNMHVITAADIEPIVASRPLLSHKGSFGHVLVVGGSLGKAGAAAMSGMAALRAGTGLVTVATPRGVLESVAGFAPELMTEPLPETSNGSIALEALGRLEEMEENKSVVAVGPGITRDSDSAEFVRLLAAKCKLPLVIDADGINAFEGKAEELHGRNRPLIITPHPGEMGRLTGLTADAVQRDRVKVARDFAMAHRAIVVLKGWHTLVTEPDGAVWVNTTGNPGMATGGTGDILTGIIAGMVAQAVSGQRNPKSGASLESTHHSPLFLYVLAAVFLHGLAGDLGRDELGEHSLVATDLLKYLPAAFRAVHARAKERFIRLN
jgi:ADP-dependent NAD(P)H-hydrate dehydratase / NAD(P)H-hydrate epimerase